MQESREKFTDESLQRLIDRIRKNAEFRTEMIDKIRKNGVKPVLDEFFALSAKQTANMGNLSATKDLEQQLNSAVLAALESGGQIRLRQPDATLIQPRTSVHVGGSAGSGGVSVDVDVECLQ